MRGNGGLAVGILPFQPNYEPFWVLRREVVLVCLRLPDQGAVVEEGAAGEVPGVRDLLRRLDRGEHALVQANAGSSLLAQVEPGAASNAVFVDVADVVPVQPPRVSLGCVHGGGWYAEFPDVGGSSIRHDQGRFAPTELRFPNQAAKQFVQGEAFPGRPLGLWPCVPAA